MFWNKQQNRIRALWRILIQFSMTIAIMMGVMVILKPLLAVFIGVPQDNQTLNGLVMSFGGLSAAFISLGLMSRFVDRRNFNEYGLSLSHGWWWDMAFGLFLGAALVTFMVLLGLALGVFRIDGVLVQTVSVQFWFLLFLHLIRCILVGVSEEMIFRGYQLKNAAEGLLGLTFNRPRLAVLIAWLLSSSVFSAFHLMNPNSSLPSFVGVMLGGLLLGVGYVLTKSIAIPIGMHSTWNFFTGNVYGFSVSGTNAGESLIQVASTGSVFWTGGEFGPEAGLIGIITSLLGLVSIILYVRWRYQSLALSEDIAQYHVSPAQSSTMSPISVAAAGD